MSNRTSHRRHARRHTARIARSFEDLVTATAQRNAAMLAAHAVRRPCDRSCDSQCDDCHTLDNCVAGTRQFGDLLLCESCRAKYPAAQPWRIDPESGEAISTKTGKPFVFEVVE